MAGWTRFFPFCLAREGVGILFVVGILVIGLVAFILEKRTSKMYVDRGPSEDDDWDL